MRELTAKQKAACALLGRGVSQVETARQVEVDEDTIRNWLKHTNGVGEAMAAEIKRHADQFTAEILGRAMGTVAVLLDNEDPMARIGASRVLVDRLKSVEKRNSDLARLQLDREKWEAQKQQIAQALEGGAQVNVVISPGRAVDSSAWLAQVQAQQNEGNDTK